MKVSYSIDSVHKSVIHRFWTTVLPFQHSCERDGLSVTRGLFATAPKHYLGSVTSVNTTLEAFFLLFFFSSNSNYLGSGGERVTSDSVQSIISIWTLFNTLFGFDYVPYTTMYYPCTNCTIHIYHPYTTLVVVTSMYHVPPGTSEIIHDCKIYQTCVMSVFIC